MNNDPRGTMMQHGNLVFINNALVEEVSCSNDFFSQILVSYAIRENGNTTIQTILLNLNQKTLILDESGINACLCCLRPGMWVNVVLSSQMTRSNPPQANALLVAIQRTPQHSMPPQRPTPPPMRPNPPQRPPMRPRPMPPQNEWNPQMPPPFQRPNQSQMQNWWENTDSTQMMNGNGYSDSTQMSN